MKCVCERREWNVRWCDPGGGVDLGGDPVRWGMCLGETVLGREPASLRALRWELLDGASLCGGHGAEWTRSEVGVSREIMAAQAIKDLAGQGEDFGFCSEMGSQGINEMLSRICLPLKRVEKGWDGGEGCRHSSSVFVQELATLFIRVFLAWILIWKKYCVKTPLVLIPEFFLCPYMLCWSQGPAQLWPHSGQQKAHRAKWGASQKPAHLLGKREQWWTRNGEEQISWIYFPDAWDASGNEGKNKESGMTSSFLVCAARRIDLLAQMGKSRFGEDQELCCRLCWF